MGSLSLVHLEANPNVCTSDGRLNAERNPYSRFRTRISLICRAHTVTTTTSGGGREAKDNLLFYGTVPAMMPPSRGARTEGALQDAHLIKSLPCYLTINSAVTTSGTASRFNHDHCAAFFSLSLTTVIVIPGRIHPDIQSGAADVAEDKRTDIGGRVATAAELLHSRSLSWDEDVFDNHGNSPQPASQLADKRQ